MSLVSVPMTKDLTVQHELTDDQSILTSIRQSGRERLLKTPL